MALVRGLVLAGGRSERFGRDKAGLPVGGVPLLERTVAVLARVVSDVRVAVRRDQLADDLRRRFVLVSDEHANIGPAAGLLAAHRLDPAAAWLVLACDMPNVNEESLSRLMAARVPGCGATAYRASPDGLPEPLCAIYEPATLTQLRREVDAGRGSGLRNMLCAVHSVLLDAPGPDALVSINTPEDLDRLTRQ